MPFAKSHSESDAKKRAPKANRMPDGNVIRNGKKYQKTEAIIDDCYADYINGETKTHIIKKLVMGLYPPQEGKGYTQITAEQVFQLAFDRIKNDMNLKREEATAMIMSRFDSIYQDGITIGDRQSALRALENMAKLYGISGKEEKTIEISKKDDSVKITFGYGNGNDEEVEQ